MIALLKARVEWLACRSWLGTLISRAQGEWIRSPSVPRGVPAVDVYAPRGPISDATRASLFWGFHEAQEVRYVNTYLPPDPPVVELGTNLGVVSSHIARRLNGANKLVCVEANAPILALARESILMNAPNVNLVTIFGAKDYGSGSTSSFSLAEDLISSRLSGNGGDVVKVPSVTFEEVLVEAGVTDYALVCDIEGAESQILRMDIKTLDRCKMMIIELHASDDASVSSMKGIIEEAGFQLAAERGAVYVFSRT